MRVLLVGLLVAVVGLGSASPASAASPNEWTVSIEPPPTIRIHQNARTATLSPVVLKEGNVRILSKRLTVRRGGSTVARDARQVRVLPGIYNVTTRITVQPFKLVGTGKFEWRRLIVAGPTMPPVSVTCTWQSMTKVGNWYGASATCVSPQFTGTWYIGDIFLDPQPDGSYTGQVPMLGTPVVAVDPMALLGTTFTGAGVPQEDLFLKTKVEVMKRDYGRIIDQSKRNVVQVIRRSGPYVNAKGCADPSDASMLTRYTTRKRAAAILGSQGVRWGSYEQFDWTGDGVYDGWTQMSAFRTCDPADLLLVRFPTNPETGPDAYDQVVQVDYQNR